MLSLNFRLMSHVVPDCDSAEIHFVAEIIKSMHAHTCSLAPGCIIKNPLLSPVSTVFFTKLQNELYTESIE